METLWAEESKLSVASDQVSLLTSVAPNCVKEKVSVAKHYKTLKCKKNPASLAEILYVFFLRRRQSYALPAPSIG